MTCLVRVAMSVLILGVSTHATGQTVSSTTGAINMWIRIPSLSHSVDTPI